MKTRKVITLMLAFCGTAFTQSALATKYVITDLGANGGGFVANVLHNNGIFAHLGGATGTYDDVTGNLDITYSLITPTGAGVAPGAVAPSTISFSGSGFGFDSQGFLASSAQLNMLGSGPDAWSTAIDFMAGPVCCSGATRPNSFVQASGDVFLLTLWGDNKELGFWPNTGEVGYVGADIRLKLQAVPLPAAVWLFGSALVGLAGLRRRRNTLQVA